MKMLPLIILLFASPLIATTIQLPPGQFEGYAASATVPAATVVTSDATIRFQFAGTTSGVHIPSTFTAAAGMTGADDQTFALAFDPLQGAFSFDEVVGLHFGIGSWHGGAMDFHGSGAFSQSIVGVGAGSWDYHWTASVLAWSVDYSTPAPIPEPCMGILALALLARRRR